MLHPVSQAANAVPPRQRAADEEPVPPSFGDADSRDLMGRYQLLVELVPDAVVVHQDGRVVYANLAALRMTSGTKADVLGQEIVRFVHPDDRPALIERVKNLTEPGVPSAPAHLLLLRLDGGTTPVESVSVSTMWQGRSAHQVIMRDLTQHKAAEAALRLQAALVQHVSDAIIATDPIGRVTSWNPAAEKIFAIPVDQALGRLIVDLVGPTLDPRTVTQAQGVQAEIRRIDGLMFAVRATATPLADAAGYVLLCSDETAWRDAQQRFSAVVSALEEGVVATDSNGVVMSANPAAERLLGLSAESLIGRPAGLLPLLDEDGVQLGDSNPLVLAHRTGTPQQDRVVVVDLPDGHRLWLTAHSGPLFPGSSPTSAVLSLTDVTERRAAAAQLRHAATHDALTSLPNRTKLLEELTGARRHARRRGQALGILYVDLDHFKAINDTAGHTMGDEALRLVADRLAACVRQSDVVARIGGDEFVVLTTVTGPDDAQLLAQRILAVLAHPVTGRLRGHHLRASIGVVTVPVDDQRGPDDLLRDADAAMHQAKNSGRNRAATFDSQLRADLLRRLQLESDLRGELEDGGLWVAYQPLVDLATGRWSGAEALSRWTHPTLGPINPMEFVTIAEQSDMIHTLGQGVLATACRDAVAIRADGTPDFSISVNLSVRQLEDRGLSALVRATLEETGLPATALCLEVTESSLAVDEAQALRALGALHDQGIKIAVDDFGTGYSSLARLRDLPVDELKIDRAFITTLPTDQQARHVVAGIITLAHALDMHVVAEGVETAEHAGILADLDCDIAQGYHYGRPMPLADFAPAIRTS